VTDHNALLELFATIKIFTWHWGQTHARLLAQSLQRMALGFTPVGWRFDRNEFRIWNNVTRDHNRFPAMGAVQEF
jgi:hypothetical protein